MTDAMSTSSEESESSLEINSSYIEQHAILNRSTTYMAHKYFLASTTWETKNEHLTKTLFNCDGQSPISCVILGAVSKHNFHLSVMGDCKLVGEPPQPTVPYNDSCLRFSLKEPIKPSQAAFTSDFRKFVKVIHDIIDAMPGVGDKCGVTPFLTRSKEGRWLFNFKFKIFEEKNYETSTRDEDDPLRLDIYPVPEKYLPFDENFDSLYYPRRLPLWDNNVDAVDPMDYAGFMKDALVKIHINLTHNNIAGLNAEIIRISIIQ